MKVDFLGQPFSYERMGDYLKQRLEESQWTHFRAAVAFVKDSGIQHLAEVLREFARRASVIISVGIDVHGSSKEGLQDLIDSIGSNGQVWVYHNRNPSSTFHPKVYLFKSESEALVVTGSVNLTESALFTNCEAAFAVLLDLSNGEDRDLLAAVEAFLNQWSDEGLSKGAARVLTQDALEELVHDGLVPLEAQMVMRDRIAPSAEAEEAEAETVEGATGAPSEAEPQAQAGPFPHVPVPAAPARPQRRRPSKPRGIGADDIAAEGQPTPPPASPSTMGFSAFVMTLQNTDVGVGQTTQGTQRRSPEVFIPVIARDADPGFWDWPALFVPDAQRPGKMDRLNVRLRIGGIVVPARIWYNPTKRDVRIRSEVLRSAGNIDDILHMTKIDPQTGADYEVEVVAQSSPQYADYLALCANPTRNSLKRWGYF